MAPKTKLDSIPPICFVVLTLAILVVGANAAQAAHIKGMEPHESVILAGVCDGAVTVFSVQNTGKPWAGRGVVRIVEARTGRVMRERRLALGERQMASFRLQSRDMRGGNARVTVRQPDGLMTYVKSFSGRCIQPKGEVREAQR